MLNIPLPYSFFSKPCIPPFYASNSYIPPTFSSENFLVSSIFLLSFFYRLLLASAVPPPPPPPRFNYRHEQMHAFVWDHCKERGRILTRWSRCLALLFCSHNSTFYNLYQDEFPNRVCTRYDMITFVVISYLVHTLLGNSS